MKTCQCCGYKTLQKDSIFDICPICYWEDDPVCWNKPDYKGGANGLTSLKEAQINFIKFGACDKDCIDVVRRPNKNDKKDLGWRPLEEIIQCNDKDSRLDEVIIDVSNIYTIYDLHEILKEKLDFPDFYGMNWDAFWDAITGLVSMPYKLKLIGWSNFEKNLPKDAEIMKSMLYDLNTMYKSWACEVEYK